MFLGDGTDRASAMSLSSPSSGLRHILRPKERPDREGAGAKCSKDNAYRRPNALFGSCKAVTRILSPQEIIDDGWHPLSGVPAPEFIPPFWIGPHVGKRLAEAMHTLRAIPINGVPQAFGNSWPEYRIEWTDQLAQLEGDQAQQEQEAAARNWARVIPSSVQIAHMETAISWPAKYLGEVPQLLRVVGAVAHAKARYREMPWVAQRLKLPHRLVRRWNNEGLDLIAAGLIRDDVEVF
jgi:hypothetical protein